LHDSVIAEKLEKVGYIDKISSFLSQIDTGIKSIKIKEKLLSGDELKFANALKEVVDSALSAELIDSLSKRHELELYHEDKNGNLIKFTFDEESLGTKSIISLLIPVFQALNNGAILIVDEIESSLHPLLVLEVIRLFGQSITNPLGAQLFFSTHETNILCSNVLRRDQIWFSEKTEEGNTVVTPLTDFSLRKNYNLESGYLEGRFGAIPFLGDIEKLFRKETSING
jgi:AAA15 family ATPase/GTPase